MLLRSAVYLRAIPCCSCKLTRSAFAPWRQAVVTLKHFDGQTVEDSDGWNRHTISANVSKYMLADTYFPAFERSIKGGAKGVMCACECATAILFSAAR